MDALVKTERGPGLNLMQVPAPTPAAGEVLIRIKKTAICGTDVHIYNWDPWSEEHIRPPMVVGHEYVGHIAALGEGVTGLEVGQRVSGEGHIVCGQCRNCRAGNEQWCKNTRGVGVDRTGAFAEYLCIPAFNVIPIDDGIPDDIVAFFDAYGNAAHTALMFDVTGEDVLITGAGPIGVMAAAICRHNGARRVVITDVNEYRLELAKTLGATAAVNVAKESLTDVMAQQGIVEGFDVGLEMSGNGSAFNQMLKSMRNGGKISLLGIAAPGTVIDWNDVIFKGLTLQGIYGRKMDTWYKMQAMIQGGLDLSPVVTHRFNYRDFEKGFAAMNSGKSGKVILDWTK
ncbi:MAG: L-threonine 3-dehydrogenase [Clostridia bacterium]|nr:L-threonine 3-dehydrogenase [Clostridia bacterium]